MGFRLRRQQALDGDSLRALLAERPAQAIVAGAAAGVLEAQALLGRSCSMARASPRTGRWRGNGSPSPRRAGT